MNEHQNNKIIYDFLLASTQRNQDLEDIQLLASKITQLQLWYQVYSRSYMHGIFIFIYQVFSKLDIVIDKEICEFFHLEYLNLIKNNMLMSSKLVRLNKLFQNNNIKPIALKGPALSQLLYNNVLYRQYADIDILVSKENVYDAASLMKENKYYTTVDIKFLKNHTYLNVAKDMEFVHSETGMVVELHWQLSSKKIMTIDDKYFKNYQTIKIYNHQLKIFANEDLLIYLCIHGSKHLWERLEWIVDIDRLITNSSDFDWSYIIASARKLQSQDLLLLGLLVTKVLFKTEIPVDIEKLIKPEQIALHKIIIEFLYQNQIANDIKAVVDIKGIRFNALQKDSFVESFLTYIRGYFQIKETDVTVINFPVYLSLLYYLIRPMRLFIKYINLLFSFKRTEKH